MTKRFLTLLVSCAALVACGGGDEDHVNAASARTFSYGDAEAAPLLGAGDAIDSLLAFQSAGDETSAVAAQGSLMAVAFEALGDEFGVGGFAATENPTALVRDARSRTFAAALTGDTAQFTTACTVVAKDASGTTTVEFKNCTLSEASTDGTTLTVNANGRVIGTPGSVAWDVTYNLSMTGPDATFTVGYHDVGNIDLTATSVKAHQEADIGAAFSSGTQHAQLGLAQSVDLDVTIGDACASSITGGTLEAKRVWTRRPAGTSAEETADRGALFTWTDCDTVTVQFSR
jgi:hypothetical protein